MSYTLYNTDGSTLTVVKDSEIDQISTDLTFIGKNVSNYGQLLNENFVKLLENFANSTAPIHPKIGQIWYDTGTNRIKVYNGTAFTTSGGPIVSTTLPSSFTQGDLWINNTTNQLHFYDGQDLILAGPIYTNEQGLSGPEVVSVEDSSGNKRTIVKMWASNVLLGIYSKEEFIPKTAIAQFSGTIYAGYTASTLSGSKIHATVTKADTLVDSLGNLKTTDSFVATDANSNMAGTLSIQNDLPLVMGPNANNEVHITAATFQIKSNNAGQTFKITVKSGNNTLDAITVDSVTDTVGIFNNAPEYTLDVGGSFRAQTSFMLPKYTTSARDARTLTSANNGELIYNTTTNKIQAYANGTWVDLN